MKKKLIAVLTALAVMTLGTATVFAADSPSVEKTENPVDGQTTVTSVEAIGDPSDYADKTSADGYDVTAVSDTTAKATAAAVQNSLLNNLAATGDALGNDALKKAATDGSKVTAKVVTVVDIDPTSATKGSNGKYSITLKNADIKSGDNIAVMHWNGTSWEVIKPTSVADGSVTFEVSDLSPIAVVKMDISGVVAAPKTGETLPLVAVISLLALVGSVVAAKKYFA